MNKRDKKRLAARVSEVPHQRDWDEWERDMYYLHRRPEPIHVPEKSPYRSDAENILKLGLVILTLLGLEILARIGYRSHTLLWQILGWVLWLVTTATIFLFITATVRTLWKGWRGR